MPYRQSSAINYKIKNRKNRLKKYKYTGTSSDVSIATLDLKKENVKYNNSFLTKENA